MHFHLWSVLSKARMKENNEDPAISRDLGGVQVPTTPPSAILLQHQTMPWDFVREIRWCRTAYGQPMVVVRPCLQLRSVHVVTASVCLLLLHVAVQSYDG